MKKIENIKKEILKETNSVSKGLIIVGFAMDISDIVNKGFILDIEPVIAYRRRAERDFIKLLKNKSKILKLIRNKPVNSIEPTLFYDFDIKNQFLPSFEAVKFNSEKMVKDYLSKGYKKLDKEKIIKELSR